jgi:DNA (cytosine-5)-methyltransferase 3A
MTNILSLCDGMSCGQIALRELGVQHDKYFASEIDRHCIRQTKLNFPATVQLGDIEKWREWDIDWASIGLILAGTPCTGFSFCGKMLNFSDPQSRLIFCFFDILNHVKKHNPDVLFLLENVRMKKQHSRVISERVGVQPVMINSALVSAQNRVRLYWSNIRTKQAGLFGEVHTDIPQPEDRGLVLKDILEENVPEKYFLSEKKLKAIEGLHKNYKPKINPAIAGCLTVNYGKKQGLDASVTLIQVPRGKNSGGLHDKKCPTISANSFEQNNFVVQLNRSMESGGVQPYLQTNIRRLTPTECARLQTVPEWYKWECSDTQQYAMLGNGWTIEVIKHILRFLPEKFYHNGR